MTSASVTHEQLTQPLRGERCIWVCEQRSQDNSECGICNILLLSVFTSLLALLHPLQLLPRSEAFCNSLRKTWLHVVGSQCACLCVCARVCVCFGVWLPPKVAPTTCCLLRFIALSSYDSLSARHAKTAGCSPRRGAKWKRGRKPRDGFLSQIPWFCLRGTKDSFGLRALSNCWVSWFCLGVFTAHCCPEMTEAHKC